MECNLCNLCMMQLVIKCDCSSGHLQFNARSETVAEKSVFSRLLARQRCVVLFNGFYEWKKVRLWNAPACLQGFAACFFWTMHCELIAVHACRKVLASSLSMSTWAKDRPCAWQACLMCGQEEQMTRHCIPTPS